MPGARYRGGAGGRHRADRRHRVQLNVDAFNLFNANPVLAQRNVYGRDGATWQRPELVLPARLVKVGFNIAF